ncbi:Transcriptional regulator [Frankia canadensis]|uniref:Transcriptional regulator n=1 Tax=Frankia canadensis TaxID=1836972 RepID=A0A2I2L0A7_9ACTN|nr:TetR/AcrR family transcriptional regulator [Frankia canadensis]SNQ51344.1 Transcriptional regulator [Frankia canadensis]SOU58634.1 Transcriptional regulator [Frankia canadensis]
MATAAQPRRLRADAARNRRLLLDTAATAFAEQGIEVSIAEIAQRAGVGKGTVFRHFPTKEDLIAAIVGDQLDYLSDAGDALLESADPTAALIEFMTLGVDLQARDRSVCQIAIGVVHNDPEIKAAADRLGRTATALTERAREHGGIRDDVTGQDVLLLLRGAYQAAAPLAHVAPELGRRYLAVIVAGLRPATSPLPGPIPGPSLSIDTMRTEVEDGDSRNA